jgi:hypothetical protein
VEQIYWRIGGQQDGLISFDTMSEGMSEGLFRDRKAGRHDASYREETMHSDFDYALAAGSRRRADR